MNNVRTALRDLKFFSCYGAKIIYATRSRCSFGKDGFGTRPELIKNSYDSHVRISWV